MTQSSIVMTFLHDSESSLSDPGFTPFEITDIRDQCKAAGFTTILYDLSDPSQGINDLPHAIFLIVKNGINMVLSDDYFRNELYKEQSAIYDGNENDDDTPITLFFQNQLNSKFNHKEGFLSYSTKQYKNDNYDTAFYGGPSKTEIGVNLGESIAIHFHWFSHNKAIGKRVIMKLDNGDLYFMSRKTTGHDWTDENIPTVRRGFDALDADRYTIA